MSDLPAPLTPPDCDIRGLEWMPLYGNRLFGSTTWLTASPEARGAALALWWAAWTQKPAGSLPADDHALAQLAGYGLVLRAWSKIKSQALRGFVRCSDGRLYHPVVATLALDAWHRRQAERGRKAVWRERCRNGVPVSETGTGRGRDAGQDAGRNADVPADSTGQDKTGKKDSPSLRSGDARAARLPDDWQPSADDRTYAQNEGLDPDRVAAAFCDYWHAAGGTNARKRDWSAAWRGWCRREAERRSGRRSNGGGKLDWLPPVDGLFDGERGRTIDGRIVT